jgi:hypothetical protein
MRDITLVLQAIGRGERQASSDLLPLVYEELRRLAAARMARESACLASVENGLFRNLG